MNQAIPLETQTLYAELLERLRVLELERTFGHLAGGFGRKVVEGKTFWYFRTSEGGHGRSEFYVGPDSESTLKLMAHYRPQRREALEAQADLARMASMLTIGGCMRTDAPSARVISALASGGIFRLGGVLVGTHAYIALGNLLGFRWVHSTHTQDIDFAAFRTLEVGVSHGQTDLWGTLDALQMGFLPVPGLDPNSPHTSYSVRGQKLRVDLLTTASRRGPFTPIRIPRFQAAALPMLFMDYLLEGNIHALALSGGVSLVKVPDPARYGFHKLLVADERSIAEQTKVAKDIAQASEMLGLLLRLRPGDVERAYGALKKRGLGKRVARTAARHLPKESPILNFISGDGKVD